jgi:Ca-activated chloride channel homolog
MKKLTLMKSRIFLLLVAFHVMAGWLIGQTTPPASTPVAPQNAPEKTSTPPDGKTQAPAAPAGQAPQLENPPKSDSDESLTTIVKLVNEVRVVFTVTDRHGRYIKDLKRTDFRVIDDQKPAEMRSFRSETDLPLQVGLLVDASNSVRDRFKFEQEAAIEFLNAIIRPKYDKAFVIGFDATPEVTQACACCARAAEPRCTTRSTMPAGTSC